MLLLACNCPDVGTLNTAATDMEALVPPALMPDPVALAADELFYLTLQMGSFVAFENDLLMNTCDGTSPPPTGVGFSAVTVDATCDAAVVQAGQDRAAALAALEKYKS